MKTKITQKVKVNCPICHKGKVEVEVNKNIMGEVVRGLRKQGLTIHEIMKETGLKSTSGVAYHFEK